MKKLVLIVLPAILLAVSGCSHKDENRIIDFTGTWQETESAPSFGGTTYRITFLNNKDFRLYLSIFSDMLPMNHNDSCQFGHLEYIKGTYSTSGDVLTLSGNYCDPGFLADQPNCDGGVSFHEAHQFTFEGSRLVLNPNENDYYRIVMDKQ